MFERIKEFLKIGWDFFIVAFSRDYEHFFTNREDDFYKGKCPYCDFNHSQSGIKRHLTFGGRCKFLGVFDTSMRFSSSKCSNPECKRVIKWYRRIDIREDCFWVAG